MSATSRLSGSRCSATKEPCDDTLPPLPDLLAGHREHPGHAVCSPSGYCGENALFFVQNLEIELFSLLQPALILVQDSEVGGGEDCLNPIRREKLGYCPRAQEMILGAVKVAPL